MTRLAVWFALLWFCAAAFAAPQATDDTKAQTRNQKRKRDKGKMRGLVAHYYSDPTEWDGNWTVDSEPRADAKDWTFTAYDRTRIEPLVNRFFIRRGWFSVRWKGFITVPERGAGAVGSTTLSPPRGAGETSITFKIWADDGCRLFIDGKELIDDWRPTWEKDPRSHRVATTKLTAGKHAILVEYFQGQSLPRRDRDPMKLYWSCPARNIPRQIVPASAFSHVPEDLIPEPGRLDPLGEEFAELLRERAGAARWRRRRH